MLTLLRDDSATATEDGLSYEPARGLSTLEPLLETYRAAGLQVVTTVSGVPHDLSASADLCAYRIVQEALTNTLKHAAAGTATVGLHYLKSAVQILIADDGSARGGRSLATGGYGLVGMRERASLIGGQVEAGPAPSGGFIVTATIPYRSGATKEGDW